MNPTWMLMILLGLGALFAWSANRRWKLAGATALFLSPLTLASCAPLAQFLLDGRLEPASAAEAQAEPEAAVTVPETQPTRTTTPILPGDMTFSHGRWHLMRTPRALYGWTGAGEQRILFAVELRDTSACWYSQRANGPEAVHCPEYDAPLASVITMHNGVKETSVFSEFDEAPWTTDVAGIPLPLETYALPDASGKTVGSIERGEGDELTVRASSWSSGAFTLSSSEVVRVNGTEADLFDGCAAADGTVAVIGKARVLIGKKKCGVFRFVTSTTATLKFDMLEISFSRKAEAPDLVEARAMAANARKLLPATSSRVEVSGDASKTLIAYVAKKPDGDGRSMVEAVATVLGAHYQCSSLLDRFDPNWLQTVKAICGSMAK